jgi:hypothetical protein
MLVRWEENGSADALPIEGLLPDGPPSLRVASF